MQKHSQDPAKIGMKTYEMKLKSAGLGAPGWLSPVEHPTLAQVTISQFCEFEPRVGLAAVSASLFALEPLSTSLSAPPLLVFSLSLSKEINKLKNEKEKLEGKFCSFGTFHSSTESVWEVALLFQL